MPSLLDSPGRSRIDRVASRWMRNGPITRGRLREDMIFARCVDVFFEGVFLQLFFPKAVFVLDAFVLSHFIIFIGLRPKENRMTFSTVKASKQTQPETAVCPDVIPLFHSFYHPPTFPFYIFSIFFLDESYY